MTNKELARPKVMYCPTCERWQPVSGWHRGYTDGVWGPEKGCPGTPIDLVARVAELEASLAQAGAHHVALLDERVVLMQENERLAKEVARLTALQVEKKTGVWPGMTGTIGDEANPPGVTGLRPDFDGPWVPWDRKGEVGK